MDDKSKVWWKSRTNQFALMLGVFATGLLNTPFMQTWLSDNIESAPPALSLILAVAIIAFRAVTTVPVRLK